MLHLLKKINIYTTVTAYKAPINIHIKIYLWSFVDYQHLQKHFYNWNITLNYWFIYKINIRGSFTWKCPLVASNIHISTTLSDPLWKNINYSKSYVLAVPIVISFKVLNCFSINKNKFLSISLPVITRSQTKKLIFFFSEILTHTTVDFFHKKNVGLWLEFALFVS